MKHIDPHKPFKFNNSGEFFEPELITVKIKFRNIKKYANKVSKFFRGFIKDSR